MLGLEDHRRIEYEAARLENPLLRGDKRGIETATESVVAVLRQVLKQISDRERLMLTDADVSILITDWADGIKGHLLKIDLAVLPGDVSICLKKSAEEFEGALMRLSMRRRAECFRDAVRASNVMKAFAEPGQIADGPPKEGSDV